MARTKGPKRPKMLFTVKRIDRKKIRNLKGEALAKATAEMEAKWAKAASMGMR